jgi:hypothetical protein
MLLGEGGWVGLLAAAVVAEARPSEARHRLESALSGTDPAQRAYAAMSSAWTDEGLGLARHALADETPSVRVAAAAAVLRILRRQG